MSGVDRHALLALSFIAASGSALGDEREMRMFSLSGFGTLGVVHSSEHRADFVSTLFRPEGAGYTDSWSPEVDTRLGVQLVGRLSSQVSATVQLISEQDHDGSFVPHVEWANIKYQVTPQLSVRVGRIALASFLVSDSLKVGYANPWVRPPDEAYGIVPISRSDGVDASFTLQLGGLVHTLLAGYGQTNSNLPGGGRVRGRRQLTLSDTVEYGPATLRIAYQQGFTRVDSLDALFQGFRQFGAQGIALAERYDPNGKHVSFVAIGGMYDPGDWFLTAEWGGSNLNSVFGNRMGWYATAGYRISSVTPYVTYARSRADSNTSDPGLTVTGPLAGSAAGLNAALNQVLALIPVQQTISTGIRWDFIKNVALKLQYDHKNLGARSSGNLANVQPDFQPGGNLSLISATIDFVW